MSTLKCTFLFVLLFFSVWIPSVQADDHKKIKILYMGGRDHDWKGYYESIVPLFKKQGDFELIFSNKLDDLKAENIKRYSGYEKVPNGDNVIEDSLKTNKLLKEIQSNQKQ